MFDIPNWYRSSATCFVFRFNQNDQKRDIFARILMVYEGRLICFLFSNSGENFGQIDIDMMIPYLRRQVKVQFGVKIVIFTLFGTAGGEYFNNEG